MMAMCVCLYSMYIFGFVCVERVPLLTRFSRANRVEPDSIAATNVEGKRKHGSGRSSGPLLSGTTYCISSCSMILLNKIILLSYACDARISLMLYQSFALLSLFGAVTLEKLNWKLIRLWLPVNIIFVAMLVSSMYSLKFINIAMVTILKNVTNILTAIGELYIFRKRQNQQVWTAMFLMVHIYTPKNLFQELEMAKGTFRLHAKCRTRGRYFYQRLWICMQS
ncbi:GDP-mannose transporter gonst2 [Orobanche hederae]